jgi:hypothetical protein
MPVKHGARSHPGWCHSSIVPLVIGEHLYSEATAGSFGCASGKLERKPTAEVVLRFLRRRAAGTDGVRIHARES